MEQMNEIIKQSEAAQDAFLKAIEQYTNLMDESKRNEAYFHPVFCDAELKKGVDEIASLLSGFRIRLSKIKNGHDKQAYLELQDYAKTGTEYIYTVIELIKKIQANEKETKEIERRDLINKWLWFWGVVAVCFGCLIAVIILR